MQTPHLLESLAPKVTSLSQADPETLGNSKVCLHYTLASHKLENATTLKVTSCSTEHRKTLPCSPKHMQGKKGRHSGQCLGTGISYPLSRCSQESSLLDWHLLSCLVLVWLTLCREGFLLLCLPPQREGDLTGKAVAAQTVLISPRPSQHQHPHFYQCLEGRSSGTQNAPV